MEEAKTAAEEQQAPEETLALENMTTEQKEEYVKGLIHLVDKMNTATMENEPVKMFLYKLNYAVMRTGQPIPRTVCLQVPGIDKALLKKLVKKGFLKEYSLKSSRNGAVYVAYTLPDNVTFYGDQIVEVVPADDAIPEELAEHYEALEKEHLGDIEKGTGIYAREATPDVSDR